MAKESTLGLMEEDMKGTGKLIICMGKEFILGKMGGNMKVNTLMTRNKDTVSIYGLMVENTWVNGRMVNSMVKADMCFQMALREMAFGKTAKDSDGRMKMMKAQLLGKAAKKIDLIYY